MFTENMKVLPTLEEGMSLDGLFIEVSKFLWYKQIHISSKELKPCVLVCLVCVFFKVFSINESEQSHLLNQQTKCFFHCGDGTKKG